MTHCGNEFTKGMVREASVATGMPEKSVKKWIENHKVQCRKKAGIYNYENLSKKQRIRSCRPYDVYLSDKKKGKCQGNWNDQTEEAMASYAQRAASHSQPIGPENKENNIEFLVHELEKKVNKFTSTTEKLDVVAIAITKDGNRMFICGSPIPTKWFEKQREVQQSLKSLYQPDDDNQLEDVNVLRSKVTDMFNRKYTSAIKGISGTRCSYKAVDAGQVRAFNLPTGIILKRPSSYAKNSLKALLKKEDKIYFEVDTMSHEEAASPTEELQFPEATEDSDATEIIREPNMAKRKAEVLTKKTGKSVIKTGIKKRKINNVDTMSHGEAASPTEELLFPEATEDSDSAEIIREPMTKRKTEVVTKKKEKSANKSRKKPNDDIFLVEKIVGHQSKGGQQYYKIKWLDFSSKHNTWEPIENLTSVMDMVISYDKKIQSIVEKHQPIELKE
ncbi:uncharacterized protein LOC141904631 isoform X1 [Tubulanus polymorphus]